ncbi:MAG: hypothetical protein RR177_00040 [Oscillospiraceae bacterium]
MMKTIKISVSPIGAVTIDDPNIGHCGENNAVIMEITLPPTMTANVDYYRLCFDGFYSDKLTVQTGKINFKVPQGVLNPPLVKCQVIGYKIVNSNPENICRSDIFELLVLPSCGITQRLIPEAKEPLEVALADCEQATAMARMACADANAAVAHINIELPKAQAAATEATQAATASINAKTQAENLKTQTYKYEQTAKLITQGRNDMGEVLADNTSALCSRALTAATSAESSNQAASEAFAEAQAAAIAANSAKAETVLAKNAAVSAKDEANIAKDGSVQSGKQAQASATAAENSASAAAVSSAAAQAIKDSIVIDTAMSDTSQNMVQNKVIKSYVDAVDNAKANKSNGLSYTVDTPVWTNQPQIVGGGALLVDFEAFADNYYFATLKDTTGAALPTGQFKLMLNKDGYAAAINQRFNLPGLNTGNSGALTENTVVDFKTIGAAWQMRSGSVGTVKFNLPAAMQNSDFAVYASYTSHIGSYTGITLFPFANNADLKSYKCLGNISNGGRDGFRFQYFPQNAHKRFNIICEKIEIRRGFYDRINVHEKKSMLSYDGKKNEIAGPTYKFSNIQDAQTVNGCLISTDIAKYPLDVPITMLWYSNYGMPMFNGSTIMIKELI